MPLIHLLPLAEAATFTCGCAALRTRLFDPEHVGLLMVGIAATLVAGLLIVLTPEGICIDVSVLDPAQIWPAPWAGTPVK